LQTDKLTFFVAWGNSYNSKNTKKARKSNKQQTVKNNTDMFTVGQIDKAHEKVKSGADFPKYIQEIKQLGVTAFETWVIDSHTEYFGKNDYQIESQPQYENLTIADSCNSDKFIQYLKTHQQGQTDYFTFCKHCAETGVEKWFVSLDDMTCTYYDKSGNNILVEQIPQ
jgi:uncharacterized protein YbcV (DUF1398 family)